MNIDLDRLRARVEARRLAAVARAQRLAERGIATIVAVKRARPRRDTAADVLAFKKPEPPQ